KGRVASMATAASAARISHAWAEVKPRKSSSRQINPESAMPPPTPANTWPDLWVAPARASRPRHNEAAATRTHALATPAMERHAIQLDQLVDTPMSAVVAATENSPIRSRVDARHGR